MEPRRTTRSSSSASSSISTRMVKSTRVPSHELAKLKASKPMLVIPQPVLRIHKCLDDNVRMAQIESNAYIALGIKEEPIDEEYDAEGRYYEDAEFNNTMESLGIESSLNQEEEEEFQEVEGMRTTRASKKKRLSGFTDPEPKQTNQDDNNNKKKTGRNKITKEKPKNSVNNPDPEAFCPIVLRVESLAPNNVQIAASSADISAPITDIAAPKTIVYDDVNESNNNVEETTSSETMPSPKTSKPQLRIKSHQSMTELNENSPKTGLIENQKTSSTPNDRPEVGVDQTGTDNPAVRKTRRRASQLSDEKGIPENSLVESVVDSPPTSDVEDEKEEEEDDMVVSHEHDNDDSSDFQSTSSSSFSDEEFETVNAPRNRLKKLN